MKICVTGALGHIGSRLIRKIPSAFRTAEVIMIDNLVTQRYCSLFNLPVRGRYRFIPADVLEADLTAIFAGADVVVHLAALTDAARSFNNKEQVEYINYNATARVGQACRRVRCPLIHLSSTSIYGTQDEFVDEDCPPEKLQPQSPYAETKLKEERLLQELGAGEKLRFVTCRFGTICGVSPGMRFHTAVNRFCWQAVMGQPLTVYRTALHQKRPYLSLSDAVRAIIFFIKHDLFDQRIYNVLTENLTVGDIIQFIRVHIPEIGIQYVDTRIMNQLSYEVSNLRLRKQGFRFRGRVEKGIADTIKLLRNAGGNRAPEKLARSQPKI